LPELFCNGNYQENAMISACGKYVDVVIRKHYIYLAYVHVIRKRYTYLQYYILKAKKVLWSWIR